MKYQEIIEKLENIKANDLDVNKDYEAVEGINELISKLENL